MVGIDTVRRDVRVKRRGVIVDEMERTVCFIIVVLGGGHLYSIPHFSLRHVILISLRLQLKSLIFDIAHTHPLR